MLEIDADPRPGAVAPAHGVDQHVGRLQMRRSLRMSRFPAFHSRQRVLFAASASDLDQRLRFDLRFDDLRLDGWTRGGSDACLL